MHYQSFRWHQDIYKNQKPLPATCLVLVCYSASLSEMCAIRRPCQMMDCRPASTPSVDANQYRLAYFRAFGIDFKTLLCKFLKKMTFFILVVDGFYGF